MTMTLSSIDIEVIRTVFILFYFFYERYFKCKKYEQKHLSNIQQNISINKKSTWVTFIQTNIYLRASKKI